MEKEEFKKWLEEYGIDFDGCVKNIHSFMARLLHSGISPAYVSLEGYRYAETVIERAVPTFSKKLQKEIASRLLEEATIQAGISADQLIATWQEHSTKAYEKE